MAVTDQIADMLTRIRNAARAGHEEVRMPASNLKKEIARILTEEGYVKDWKVIEQAVQDELSITLKYIDNRSAITGIRRISKPGLRIYSNASEMPQVLDGLGIAIVSTSRGVYTDKACRENNVGGEVLAYVW